MIRGMSRRERRQKEERKKRRLFLVVAILLAVIIFSGCLAWNHLRRPLAMLRPPTSQNPQDEETWDINDNFDKDIVNFLFMGFDRTSARDKIYSIYRPDTMIVLSVNFRSDELVLLSIPRDSYVKMDNCNVYDKINAAYMYGHEYGMEGVEDSHEAGITCTIKTVENLLGGIPIHYYLAVDMDGVVEIVDKLGGIYYDVEFPIRNRYGRVLVDKGYQKLNGTKYLSYCRYRGSGGDTGRTQRQQQLLIATFKQLKQAGKLVKLPQLYKSLNEIIDTDLSFSQVAALAFYGREVDVGAIENHVLAGSIQWGPQGDLDICYLVINERARVELLKQLFGVEVEERMQITLPGRRLLTEEVEQVPSSIPGEYEPVQPPSGGEADFPGGIETGPGPGGGN